MEQVFNIILTALVGWLGAFILVKLKVPGGAATGSLIAVGILTIFYGKTQTLPFIKTIMQITSGMIIGSRITRATLKHMKNLWKIYIVLMLLFITQTVIASVFLYKFSDFDPITCLFSLSPGGQTDLTILSAEYNAESAIVALLHTVRNVLIYLIVPYTAHKLAGDEQYIENKESSVKPTLPDLLIVLIFAIVMGFLFKLINLKGYTMFGAVFGGALFSTLIREYKMPKFLSTFNMISSGTFTGCMITVAALSKMMEMWIGLIFIFILLMICLIFDSFVLRKMFRVPKLTSVFICTPGGLSEICMLAEELGGDIPTVATLQTARLFTVVLSITALAPVVELLAPLIK